MNKYIKITLIILLIILAAFTCFYKLSSPPLEIWDEYTNFNVVYETIQSDDKLVLNLNNKEFFEKPPLWYWLTSLSVRIFGLSRFSIRFVSALSGFGFIMTITYLGWKMFGSKAGLFSGFLTLGNKHFFHKYEFIFSTHNFRSADLDSLQLFFMMVTILCIFEFEKSKRKSWLILTGIFTGLGTMTKGPFSFLPILTYIIFNLFKSRNKKRLLLNLLTVLCSLLPLTLPWHLFMSIKFDKQFWNEYLFYHIIARSTSSIEGHFGNILFYPRLLFHRHFFVFGELLIGSIIFLIFKYKKSKSLALNHCFTGLFLSFLIITLVQTKLTWYIFYIYPFMILIIGKALSDITKLKDTTTKLIVLIPSIVAISLSIIRNLYLIVGI